MKLIMNWSRMISNRLSSFPACGISFLLFASFSFGETVFVQEEVSFACSILHINSVYQVESEVWVTSSVEELPGVCAASGGWIADALELDVPSIAVKHVGRMLPNPFDGTGIGKEGARVLFRQRAITGEYSFDDGPGWADTDLLGPVFIREYPWIFHPDFGWLFTVEGPLVKNSLTVSIGESESNPFSLLEANLGFDLEPRELSYWFWSPDRGWLFMSLVTNPWVYVLEEDAFRLQEELF